MRLLTNKQFQGEIKKATQELQEKLNKKEDIIYKLIEEKEAMFKANESHQEIIKQNQEEISRLTNELETMSEKYKKAWGSKGGLIKQMNKLQSELNEAQIKLNQRYILKELKPQKSRNVQEMKIKDSSVTSKIIKKVTND